MTPSAREMESDRTVYFSSSFNHLGENGRFLPLDKIYPTSGVITPHLHNATINRAFDAKEAGKQIGHRPKLIQRSPFRTRRMLMPECRSLSSGTFPLPAPV